jgi:serine phosphatase RsbU (regulator of sigma subunit)
MFQLVARNGYEAGRRYELRSGKYVLGRHPECQIVIDVGAVSRQHCALLVEGAACYVEDLKSRNGTFVNGTQIAERQRLKEGDVLQICEAEFQFVESTIASATPGPTLVVNKEVASLLGAVMVDDDTEGSQVMSRLDAAPSRNSGNLSTSPEVKLTALVEIMQNLGKALSLDDVLSKILASLFKIFLQADRGFIVLEQPDGKLIPRWTKARREDNADSIRISRTICRQVMDAKEAVLSADAANDQRFDMSQSMADFRIRSMMCAPLIDSEGKALGVLQIDTLDQRKRFQAEDLELFVSVASQASVAIQNAQLFEQSLKQREVERDLQLAREVQQGFLPDRKPEIPGFEFYDYYQPADQIGGDYFDYIVLPNGRLAVVVADVVGHGVAAALLMAKLSAETRYALLSEANPAAAITRINERLCQQQAHRFVTMVLVVIDPKTAKGQVVCAGHMPPIHRKADGSIVEPGEKCAGLPLGITDAMGYEQEEFALRSGETLTLYTDGINECADASGAMYSIDRLRQHIVKSSTPPDELGTLIISDVRRFLGKELQNDDMCLVCFGRQKKAQPAATK